MQRWGKHLPIWTQGFKSNRYESLCEDLNTDVVIVGGGITGIVTAYQLQRSGLNVVLLEAGCLGDGTTGHSTGHLTEILDKDFKSLVNGFGIETVQKIIASSGSAIDFIENISLQEGIDCDFARVPGFKYAESAKDLANLKDEMKFARDLGIKAEDLLHNLLPFPVAGVVEFKNQALFNPMKFITGLAKKVTEAGGKIFEFSHVRKVIDEGQRKVFSDKGSVAAKHIVLATHSPIGVYVSLHTRVAPYFSYVMGVRLKNPPPQGLYWDTETPYNYLRPFKINENIWIIGGRDHKTGQVPTTLERYIELENYIHQHFEAEEILFYWGDELYESVDGLPYVGKIPFTNSIYTGTGFSGTGLTFGTLCGIITADILLGRDNKYAPIYDPSRFKPVASASNFIKENMNVAKWMIGELFDHHQITELKSLTPEEGKIVDTELGKLAVYKDKNGNLQALSSTCTHMGGTVHWNAAEKSWDCPCHGGRFNPTGEVFAGPPLENLEKIPFNTEKVPKAKEAIKSPLGAPDFVPAPDNLGLI